MITLGEYTGWRKPKPSCDGKQRFKSQGAAEAAMRALAKREERGGPTVKGEPRAYHCSNCGGWHHGRIRQPAAAVNHEMS